MRGEQEFIEVLLKHKANCNIQDSEGNTPLHLAIQKGHNGCFETILEGNTANINLVNAEHNSPLHLAVKVGCVTIADKLLDMEPYHNAVDNSGNTALHLLAKCGYLNCCVKLLSKYAENLNAKNNIGDTPLHLATQAGRADIVTLFQSYPGDCNSQNYSQNTPLHLAVNEGHLSCVKELLKFNNLMIDSSNKDGSTALHCAVKKGNLDIVSVLLSHHADCNAKDSLGNTPLHCAVTKGNTACCEKLLQCSDLELNEVNTSREAALHIAARLGRYGVCDLILKHPKKIIDIKDKQEHTPLHLATEENNHEVVRLLLSKGANWKLRDKHNKVPLHYAAEKGYEISCEYLVKALNESEKCYAFKLKNRRTPLILAAMGGHHHCCEMLPLDDIDLADKFGKTALIYAIEEDYVNTASFLLKNNAKTVIKGNKAKKNLKENKGHLKEKEHKTVLHLAAEKRADKCLAFLLQDPNTKELLSETDEEGHTPLHEAINSEALECAKILLSYEASPTAITKMGMTPLHLAAKKGDPGLCSLLLDYEIDMNAETNDQETPLHLAAKHGCLDACKVLMKKKGIRKIAKDKSGCTPLHLAAKNGHVKVVQFLLKKGGHPYERDDKDSTALHLAAAKGHLPVCEILVSNATCLVNTLDKEGKLPVDVAFENKEDDVFAFLISKLKPKADVGSSHSSPNKEKNNKTKNAEKMNRFHKYMHEALQPKGQNKPREVVAEGILASEWWTAAFFTKEEEKDLKSDTEDDSEHLDTQGRSPYCTNFHEMIKSHPNLALKALDHCHANLPPESGQNLDFRLFEDNMCPEAGVKHSRRSHTPMAGQRLLQDHPVSLMMMKEECPSLLQHPFTDSWLRHFWRTSVFYIYTILLIIEVFYLASLHFFMDNVDNWVQIQHKCNTTQEQFCRLSSSSGMAEVALHHTDTTQGGPLLGMAVAQVDSNFRCSQRTSLWQWIFVVVMTVTIASLECICVYRLRMAYLKWKRFLRIVQLLLTILSWLPMGMCGFQHSISNEWQWHFGIVGLLLEWILVIGRLNELPVLFVFMPVTRRFLFGYIKALFYVTSLLFAFSYIFQLLLDDNEAFDSRPKAMVKMIVWLFGDLNYDSTFVEKPPLHPIMTTQMFVAFIIIMFGFIANLAVTLPSDRLEEFRKDAAFFQKLAQSTLLLEIQACFPWSLCQKLNDKDDKYKSNRIIKWINKTLQEIFSADIVQKSKKPQDNPLQELEQQVATLVDMCREQGKEVKELRQQLDILFKFMAEKD